MIGGLVSVTISGYTLQGVIVDVQLERDAWCVWFEHGPVTWVLASCCELLKNCPE